MGKLTLYERLKDIIGGISFNVFLWSVNMTKDNYIDSIFKQELEYNGSRYSRKQ